MRSGNGQGVLVVEGDLTVSDGFHYFGVVMRVLMTIVLLVTWVGLSKMEGAALAVGIGRFALLASAVVLWVDEHWLGFNFRLLIPALLIFLLESQPQS